MICFRPLKRAETFWGDFHAASCALRLSKTQAFQVVKSDPIQLQGLVLTLGMMFERLLFRRTKPNRVV